MRFSIFILFSFLILHSCAKREVAEIEFNSVRNGIGKIEFRKGTFEGINRIWYYNSKSAQHPKKVVFVLHGQGRLARNELYAWVRFAEAHVPSATTANLGRKIPTPPEACCRTPHVGPC